MRKPTVLLSALLLVLAVLTVGLAGCNTTTPTTPVTTSTTAAPTAAPTTAAPTTAPTTPSTVPYTERTAVKIATIQGPSGIGMSQLMEKNEKQNTSNQYTFIVEPSAQNVASLVISGEVDIACVPTNTAALLYNKLEGGAKLIALNTLGVLHILENGDQVQSVEDLAGRTLHVSGQGAVPQYAIEYILDAYGLTDSVEVVYYADHDELAALAAAGSVDLCMLPEPKVTATLMANPELRLAVDVTEAWSLAADKNGDEGSVLTMGAVVVRTAFADEHPEAVAAFLAEYETSIGFVKTQVAAGSILVEKHGIMPKAAVAAKAIPNCNLVYIDGEDMQPAISNMLDVLFASNPQSIGGALPDEGFYHIG
ncbi:MAG: ABC transporter substrate-binding protein [Clostridiaceae bacterium]|nr:ABC transporter substrate-binding protein [Clostridiaceae bacterium]